MDWKNEIAKAFLVKQELRRVDVEGLWPYYLPCVAAEEADIESYERRKNTVLDFQYRSFLKYANGWQGFFQSIDLFGLDQLNGGEAKDRADALLIELGCTRRLCGVSSDLLFPIAVAKYDIDLIVIEKKPDSGCGRVFWFAGDLVDSFLGFDEFFLAMVDYNREEIIALKG